MSPVRKEKSSPLPTYYNHYKDKNKVKENMFPLQIECEGSARSQGAGKEFAIC